MVENYVSCATIRNWQKLGVAKENKLQQRANKTLSTKKFIPIERCSSKEAGFFIERLVSLVEKKCWKIEDVLYTLIINLFEKNNITTKKSYHEFIKNYRCPLIAELLEIDIPKNEYDILGTIYQSLLTEGIKNQNGSYYTDRSVVEDMVGNFDLAHKKIFFDPCCGSGAFLLSLKNADPKCIYGADTDKNAVMIATANLMLKYLDYDFVPNIYVSNFLDNSMFENQTAMLIGKVDFIATNPPWGAVSEEILTDNTEFRETATQFFVKSFSFLKKDGSMNFLMPVSVLNVKVHRNFRQYILEHGCLETIKLYDGQFTGVTTQYVSILFSKKQAAANVDFYVNGQVTTVALENFKNTENLVFMPVEDLDVKIIDKLKNKGRQTLKNSKWALGVVTGNNKQMLQLEKTISNEPIFTGKEIKAYCLSEPKYYLDYDRKNLQQVAKDEFYRAKEKLVYKFISKKLVFAYDGTGSLFLNSANILIPKIEGMSVKTVLAFLNSVCFQYLYIKLFGEVKILKGNLMELPFPEISHADDVFLTELVDKILCGDYQAQTDIDDWFMKYYLLTQSEIEHVRRVVNGKVA